MQFGIDFACWTTGPKFMGVNLIPPGPHFIYYAASPDDYAERTGFWVYLKPRQVVVRQWDVETELMMTLEQDDELRYAEGVRQYDFDHNLGPYPQDKYANWLDLTRHLSAKTINRVEPLLKNVSHKSQEYNPKTQVDGLEPFQAESVTLFFTSIPDVSALRKKQMQGSDLTRLYMDKTELLDKVLRKLEWKELLGELEMSFVIFVLGQNYDGFEHWKSLLMLLSACERGMEQHEILFAEFIRTLFTHLQQAPEDFFQDNLSAGNFLTRALGDLLETAGESKSKLIRTRASHLAALVQKRFGVDWHDLDEDQPTVVTLSEAEAALVMGNSTGNNSVTPVPMVTESTPMATT